MTQSQYDFIKSFAGDELLQAFFCPDVCLFIACQIALESAFGTSVLATKQFNLIGMKQPSKRFGTFVLPYYVCMRDFSNVVSANFATYADVAACLADYICWVLYNRPKPINLGSAAHYASWLSGKYCPDDDYIDNITSLYNQFNNFQS